MCIVLKYNISSMTAEIHTQSYPGYRKAPLNCLNEFFELGFEITPQPNKYTVISDRISDAIAKAIQYNPRIILSSLLFDTPHLSDFASDHKLRGIASQSHNAIFVRDANDLLVERHELGHLFQHPINPKINKIDLEDPQKSVAHQATSEGLSDWLAIYLGLRSNSKTQIEQALEYQFRRCTGKNSDNKAESNSSNFSKSINLLEQFTENNNILILINPLFKREEYDRLISELGPAMYSAGLCHVSARMASLTDKGTSIKEAFTLIAASPPDSIQKLAEPVLSLGLY